MNIKKNLAIKSAGMVTSVGFNFASTCCAVRAGISGADVGFLFDIDSGEYISSCRVNLPQWWEGRGKLVDLVAPSIIQCLHSQDGISNNSIPLLLCVSASERPFRFKGIEENIIKEIEEKVGIKFHLSSCVISQDHISGIFALKYAYEFIEKGFSGCIIAGVDSFVQKDLVNFFIEKRRILSPSNSNGFIPGEAGCAVFVGPPDHSKMEPIILGIGFGNETGIIQSEEPLTGKGMTDAIRAALIDSNCSYFDIDFRITDINGEHYKFLEAHIAESRIARKFDEHGVNRDKFRDIWHATEFIGEIGATIIPFNLGWSFHSLINGYNPGTTALIHCGNDNGKRGACIVKLER